MTGEKDIGVATEVVGEVVGGVVLGVVGMVVEVLEVGVHANGVDC